LLISAVEPSGDLLAAELVFALKDTHDFEVYGVAGPNMRAAGVHPVARMEDINVMGLVEVMKRLGSIRKATKSMAGAIDSGADALVVIDGPDFNLPLARRARNRGIPAIGYVSPKVWAWRSGRVKRITKSVDQLLCLFDFEPDLYPNLDARWVGHPVLDRVPKRRKPDQDLYALLPGSRPHEVDQMLPPFLRAARLVRRVRPKARFLLMVPAELRHGLVGLEPWIEVVEGGLEQLSTVSAALTKSGTITLELACMAIPQVVAHRIHPVTYAVAHRLLTIDAISLPNILSGSRVVPEFVQNFTADDLAEALMTLPNHQPVDLCSLGSRGASQRAAEAVSDWWS